VLARREQTQGRNVAVVLSGANIDAEVFTRLVNGGR
jgi:threonine dehydratase